MQQSESKLLQVATHILPQVQGYVKLPCSSNSIDMPLRAGTPAFQPLLQLAPDGSRHIPKPYNLIVVIY